MADSVPDSTVTGEADRCAVSRMVVRIGVTGHRVLSPEAQDALVSTTRMVLRGAAQAVEEATQECRGLYPGMMPQGPVVRVVSALAEGADRIVAHCALEPPEKPGVTHELAAIIPFPPDDYKTRFGKTMSQAEASKDFDDLWDKAAGRRLVVEGEVCDGREDPEASQLRLEAYELAGKLLLEQCDLLIVAMCKDAPDKPGSAARLCRIAFEAGIPVVRLLVDRPGPPQLVQRWPWGDERTVPLEGDVGVAKVSDVLHKMLTPPAEEKAKGPVVGLQQALRALEMGRSEPRRWWHKVAEWSVNLPYWRLIECLARKARLACSDCPLGPDYRPPDPLPEPSRPEFEGAYRALQGQATHFSKLYRGAMVWNYVLGALAVAMAMGTDIWPHAAGVFSAIELACIALIVFLLFASYRWRWHEQLIDNRALTEQLRVARWLWLLGYERPSQTILLRRYMDSTQVSWMDWYFRAVMRTTPWRSDEYGRERLSDGWMRLRELIHGQIDYHYTRCCKVTRAEARLALGGLVLFLLTAVACVTHLQVHEGPWSLGALFVCTVFPAVAAACSAIALQAELVQLRQHSEQMLRALLGCSDAWEQADRQLSDPSCTLGKQARVVIESFSQVAERLLEESVDWWAITRPVRFSP